MDFDINTLSPVHFHSGDSDEKVAYNMAYHQLLAYHGHKDHVSMQLIEMLKKALISRDTDDLMHWYGIHMLHVRK